MAEKKRKQKKLTRSEKDLLKALDQEMKAQQGAANAQLADIDSELSEKISLLRRDAAAKAYEAQQTFDREKKKLDKKKKQALKEVEENYQVLLEATRSTKTFAHATLEEKLDSEELRIRREAKAQEKKVNDALGAFLQDYNTKRDMLVYGASEKEEEPDATAEEKPKKEQPADNIASGVEA